MSDLVHDDAVSFIINDVPLHFIMYCICLHVYMRVSLFTRVCPYRCVSAPCRVHHGVTSFSSWVGPVCSREESGCVCGEGGRPEGSRDALHAPPQWWSDRQQLEESQSVGSSTHLWPGESLTRQDRVIFHHIHYTLAIPSSCRLRK